MLTFNISFLDDEILALFAVSHVFTDRQFLVHKYVETCVCEASYDYVLHEFGLLESGAIMACDFPITWVGFGETIAI